MLAAKRKKQLNLDHLSDEELLKLKLCDLPVQLKGSWVETCARQLNQELIQKGLSFKPRVYLGDEWFSPDEVAAIAVPFSLFHPRLQQLEKKMMLELEGGTPESCMQLLRHECGHAIAHAYRLPRRMRWIEVFGDPSDHFDDFFHFRPYSRSFVHHLPGWYAQSHPEEDFAETFAVWLTPELNWKKRYERWPALKKLIYTEKLMNSLKDKKAPAGEGGGTYRLKNLKRTLQKHYEDRRKLYDEEEENYFDNDLIAIFSESRIQEAISAADFLKQNRLMFENAVMRWARERKYTVRRLIQRLEKRCQVLKLWLPQDLEKAQVELAAFLSALISNYIHTSRFKRRV